MSLSKLQKVVKDREAWRAAVLEVTKSQIQLSEWAAAANSSSILNFLRNLHIVFHSGCTNLHSHRQCMTASFSPQPHQRVLFLAFLIAALLQAWGDVSLWFWFAFPWWRVMLCMFSCACWPSVCLLWKCVYSAFLPVFKLGCLFFVVVDLYEFFIYFGC